MFVLLISIRPTGEKSAISDTQVPIYIREKERKKNVEPSEEKRRSSSGSTTTTQWAMTLTATFFSLFLPPRSSRRRIGDKRSKAEKGAVSPRDYHHQQRRALLLFRQPLIDASANPTRRRSGRGDTSSGYEGRPVIIARETCTPSKYNSTRTHPHVMSFNRYNI